MIRRSNRGTVPTLDNLHASVQAELNLLSRLMEKSCLVGDLRDSPAELKELARDFKSLEKRLIPLIEDYSARLGDNGMIEDSVAQADLMLSCQKAIADAKWNLNIVLRGLKLKTVSELETISQSSVSTSILDPRVEYRKSPFGSDNASEHASQSNSYLPNNASDQIPNEASALEYNQTLFEAENGYYNGQGDQSQMVEPPPNFRDHVQNSNSYIPEPHVIAFGRPKWCPNQSTVSSKEFDPRVLDPNILGDVQLGVQERLSNDDLMCLGDNLSVVSNHLECNSRLKNHGESIGLGDREDYDSSNSVLVHPNDSASNVGVNRDINELQHRHHSSIEERIPYLQGNTLPVHTGGLENPHLFRRPWTPDNSKQGDTTHSDDQFYSARCRAIKSNSGFHNFAVRSASVNDCYNVGDMTRTLLEAYPPPRSAHAKPGAKGSDFSPHFKSLGLLRPTQPFVSRSRLETSYLPALSGQMLPRVLPHAKNRTNSLGSHVPPFAPKAEISNANESGNIPQTGLQRQPMDRSSNDLQPSHENQLEELKSREASRIPVSKASDGGPYVNLSSNIGANQGLQHNINVLPRGSPAWVPTATAKSSNKQGIGSAPIGAGKPLSAHEVGHEGQQVQTKQGSLPECPKLYQPGAGLNESRTAFQRYVPEHGVHSQKQSAAQQQVQGDHSSSSRNPQNFQDISYKVQGRVHDSVHPGRSRPVDTVHIDPGLEPPPGFSGDINHRSDTHQGDPAYGGSRHGEPMLRRPPEVSGNYQRNLQGKQPDMLPPRKQQMWFNGDGQVEHSGQSLPQRKFAQRPYSCSEDQGLPSRSGQRPQQNWFDSAGQINNSSAMLPPTQSAPISGMYGEQSIFFSFI